MLIREAKLRKIIKEVLLTELGPYPGLLILPLIKSGPDFEKFLASDELASFLTNAVLLTLGTVGSPAVMAVVASIELKLAVDSYKKNPTLMGAFFVVLGLLPFGILFKIKTLKDLKSVLKQRNITAEDIRGKVNEFQKKKPKLNSDQKKAADIIAKELDEKKFYKFSQGQSSNKSEKYGIAKGKNYTGRLSFATTSIESELEALYAFSKDPDLGKFTVNLPDKNKIFKAIDLGQAKPKDIHSDAVYFTMGNLKGSKSARDFLKSMIKKYDSIQSVYFYNRKYKQAKTKIAKLDKEIDNYNAKLKTEESSSHQKYLEQKIQDKKRIRNLQLSDKKKYKSKLDDALGEANLKSKKDIDKDMLNLLDIIEQLKFIKEKLKTKKTLAHGDLHASNMIIKTNSQKRPLIQIIDPKGYVSNNIHHTTVKIPEAKASDNELLGDLINEYDALFDALDKLHPNQVRIEYIKSRSIESLAGN